MFKNAIVGMGSICALLIGTIGIAQSYPARPVRLVVATTPGAQPDILARLIGPKLSDRWGQPVVIENRPGAGGTLGANAVAKSTPDGYTLYVGSPAFAVRAALIPNLPYDTLKDFAGVTEIGFGNSALIVGATKGIKSVTELIALARTQPGKVLFGSAGAGTATHINGERFRLAAGIKVQHVGFKGQSEFELEIMAGRIHFGVSGLTTTFPFIQDGKLVALALAQRSNLLPNVPSMSEAVAGWERNGTTGIHAPAGTPLNIRQQISKEVARVLDLPEIQGRLRSVAFQTTPCSPEEHDRRLRADIAVFTQVVKEAGLRPS